MPGQRTIRSTPLFRMTQDDQCTQFPKILKQNCSRSSPMTALSGGESLRPTDEQSSKNSGSAGECFEDAQGSATPRPPETNRPVPTPLERPSVAATGDVISLAAGARPHRRPCHIFHGQDRGHCHFSRPPSTRRAWTSLLAAAPSPLRHQASPNKCTRSRR